MGAGSRAGHAGRGVQLVTQARGAGQGGHVARRGGEDIVTQFIEVSVSRGGWWVGRTDGRAAGPVRGAHRLLIVSDSRLPPQPGDNGIPMKACR